MLDVLSMLNFDLYHARLEYLAQTKQSATLSGIRRGIEKESLRIDEQARISQKPHPKTLGSALTHHSITTDYSEALLEFITPAYEDLTDCLLFLSDIHHFTYQNIGDQLLWVNSMPCLLPESELDIPIAEYGSSNIGQMKTVYRKGLWHRYGRHMQTIAGIHYNFSMPNNFWHALAGFEKHDDAKQPFRSFISEHYFNLIRNFDRFCWLPIYLFGATPAVCKSFLHGKSHELDELGEHTLHLPYATSLRLSDIGYQNDAQSDLIVSYEDVESYVESLEGAMTTPYKPYKDIGVKVDGVYKQLSSNLLQIENEYYGMVRPKRTALSGERPSNALRKRGVEYVELRLLDINPFSPVGIDADTGYFLDLFAIFCLLQYSESIDDAEAVVISDNIKSTVLQGRHPNAQITVNGCTEKLTDIGLDLLDAMRPLAEMLDSARASHAYTKTLDVQREKLKDVSKTPSAKVLDELKTSGDSFSQFAYKQSQAHQKHFVDLPLSKRRKEWFERLARESLAEQIVIEESDTISFDEFLQNWFK